MRAIVTDQFLQAKKKPTLNFPNERTGDYHKKMSEWWKEIDPK